MLPPFLCVASIRSGIRNNIQHARVIDAGSDNNNDKNRLVFLFCETAPIPTLCPFSVAVPPEQPTILDRWGRILNGTAGPYEEGDTPYLTCRVTGGKLAQNTTI